MLGSCSTLIFVMAPAVTSDTAPCSRAPSLFTRDPTSLLSVALVNLGETSVDMNSQAMPSSKDGGDTSSDALGTVPFHPFACLPTTRSVVSSHSQQTTSSDVSAKEEMHVADCAGQIVPEMVNGIGISPSQSLSSLSLSNTCRVSLKSAAPQRTVSIVIKNNGACTAATGLLSNTVHRPVAQMRMSSSCNGGSCTDTHVVGSAGHRDGTPGNFVTRPVASLHRMLITPRLPVRDMAAMSYDVSGSRCGNAVTTCDSAEQLKVVHHSKSDTEQAPSVSSQVPTTSQSDEVTLDAVQARHRNLVSRTNKTLSRLRRLQSREANSSVRRQVAGLAAALRRSTGQSAPQNDVSAVQSTPDLKSMSTLELVGFVRQMQSSEAMSSVGQSTSNNTAALLSVCPGVVDTANRLSSNLRHLESAVDSDATESSSGGETDVEEEPSSAGSDEYVVVSDSLVFSIFIFTDSDFVKSCIQC